MRLDTKTKKRLAEVVSVTLLEEYLRLYQDKSSTVQYCNARRALLKKIQKGLVTSSEENLPIWRTFRRRALKELTK